jgi:hypothetical protein
VSLLLLLVVVGSPLSWFVVAVQLEVVASDPGRHPACVRQLLVTIA